MADETPIERMSGAMSENVLACLCFDSETAKIIRPAITPALFESRVLQDIASHAIGFLDQYGTAIQDHLPDMLEATLSGDDKRRGQLYRRTLDNLFAAKDGINSKFVVAKLQEFVHQQTLKTAILSAVSMIESGKIDAAEVELEKGLKSHMHTFDVGTVLTDTTKSLAFFDKTDDGIPTNIKALDDAGVMPAPGTLFLIIAPAKKGKSWGLTHVGKAALMQKKKVLVVTLEMSEAQYTQRFIQALFSFSKRKAKNRVPMMKHNESGAFISVEMEEITRPTLADPGMRKTVEKQIHDRFKNQVPLVIKAFPTGMLTIDQYTAYLDHLERLHKFIPDIVLFDYPDLMKVGSDNTRIDLGIIFKELRGVAVERNHALVCPTQGNRVSAESRTTLDTHVAEDYSKIATADTVLTYSQTADEKRLGLARLYVANSRSEEDKFSVIITQAYALGQFALDSARMGGDYWSTIDTMSGRGTPADDEDD